MSDIGSRSPQVVLHDIQVVYDQAQRPLIALDGLDLTVSAGEFVSVIGPSGCGKSTLLRVIGGLQEPSRGRIGIDGRGPRQAQREKRIGFVFQDPSLLPWRTVAGNVALPLQVNLRGGSGEPSALVDLVGLTAFRGYYPHQLSGGMQQRVALARALVTSPALLLMDEPFGALDEITRSSMRYELLRIWRTGDERRTVVFVTHSITEAVLLSDRVIVMTAGPGRVAADLRIDLPRPRREEMELEPEFLVYARRLRGVLRERGSM